ncbi:MAG: glycoside hydrolase family 3 protein [Chitinivibrionales bacterium]|nr:glycoside hydrolase family 3 protein [Chitinivibrionales bacterium]
MKIGPIFVIMTMLLWYVTADAAVSLSGFVKDTLGNPISNAAVNLIGSTLSGVTDGQGYFSLAGGSPTIQRNSVRPVVSPLIAFSARAVTMHNPQRTTAQLALHDIAGRLVRKSVGRGAAVRLDIGNRSGMFIVRGFNRNEHFTFALTCINGAICSRTALRSTGAQLRQEEQTTALAKRSARSSASYVMHYLSAGKSGYIDGGTGVRGSSKSDILITLLSADAFSGRPDYKNPALPIETRVEDLLNRMTKQEMLDLLSGATPGSKRLGIPPYHVWNEALHGVADKAPRGATHFPHGIAMAAMWDPDMIHTVTSVISDEGRVVHNVLLPEHKDYDSLPVRGYGLNYFCPVLDLFRRPTMGRGPETQGEDPFLASRNAVAYVKGMQGYHSKYFKAIATPKHFGLYYQPRSPSEFQMRQSYFPAFKAAFVEGGAFSVMCAYGNFYSTQCCQSLRLNTTILREEWGFDGFVIGDNAISIDLSAGADAIDNNTYRPPTLGTTDENVRRSAKRMLIARYKLGHFDPPEIIPFAQVPREIYGCAEHRQLARDICRRSVVLLKNSGILPLNKSIGKVAVIGPNAKPRNTTIVGSYSAHSLPDGIVNPLMGIQNAIGTAKVDYIAGLGSIRDESTTGFAAAKTAAQNADAVILVCGMDPGHEGEGHDRPDLELPGAQEQLIKEITSVGKPTVLVLIGGSSVFIDWAKENAGAILQCWYPGQEGGNGIADVIFGDYNPAARLPITFYARTTTVPSDPVNGGVEKGLTYRYLNSEPLFPFGYGLSYTTFSYANLRIGPSSPTANDTIKVMVDVTNTGAKAGDEVVQVYVKDMAASVNGMPGLELKGFQRVNLDAGETKTVAIAIRPYELTLINSLKKRVLEPGEFTVWAGGCQPGVQLKSSNILQGSFTIGGSEKEFDI